MAWKITKESATDGTDLPTRVGWESVDYVTGDPLPYKFRMLTDDGDVIYEGCSDNNDSEEAFAPLDDLGTPDAGCTDIQYWNEKKKVWESL